MDDSAIADQAARLLRKQRTISAVRAAAARERRQYGGPCGEKRRQKDADGRRRSAAKRRAKFDALKSGPCADCGVSFHPFVMDLDHRDEETKLFAISLAYGMSLPWERVLAERAKCDLVCANCHRMRTLRRKESRKATFGPSPIDPTRCRRGHPRTPESTYVKPDGRRECRACQRDIEAKRAARRRAGGAVFGPATHCRNGHEYTPDNTYVRPDRVKACRICIRASKKRYRARRAASS